MVCDVWMPTMFKTTHLYSQFILSLLALFLEGLLNPQQQECGPIDAEGAFAWRWRNIFHGWGGCGGGGNGGGVSVARYGSVLGGSTRRGSGTTTATHTGTERIHFFCIANLSCSEQWALLTSKASLSCTHLFSTSSTSVLRRRRNAEHHPH